MNWRDMKPGDLVRLTFEANVNHVGENFLLLGDIDDEVKVDAVTADDATWELLPKPLKVGRAKCTRTGWLCDVLAIDDVLAWVRYDFNGRHEVLCISRLINIDEEPWDGIAERVDEKHPDLVEFSDQEPQP